MKHHYSPHQAELNLSAERFALARRQTTRQVRLLVKQLTGKNLTAQEILQKGRSGCFQVPSAYGSLMITSDSTAKNSRLWRWNVDFVPVGLHRAA